MNYQKEFKRHGAIHSVNMSEEDIVSVLDQLIEFYGEHGCYGEEIQQNSRCYNNGRWRESSPFLMELK